MYDNTHNLYGQKGKFMFSQEKNCGRIFGYARVSTKEQNLDRQLLALQEYVPKENIVVDKQSGKDLERPGYLALKGPLGLRSGDTLVVQSLDRLSRNKKDIMQAIIESEIPFNEISIKQKSLEEIFVLMSSKKGGKK